MNKATIWIVKVLISFLQQVVRQVSRIPNGLSSIFSSWDERLNLIKEWKFQPKPNNPGVGFSWEEMAQRKWYYPKVIWNNLPEFLFAVVIGISVVIGKAICLYKKVTESQSDDSEPQ